MIFHIKIFQCVTAPIPLFQTPQKIGLLKKWGKIMKSLFTKKKYMHI